MRSLAPWGRLIKSQCGLFFVGLLVEGILPKLLERLYDLSGGFGGGKIITG